ncbi:LuxR C-terminal-related transcriptional regulator [Actinomycetospora sp. CA-084318]|uniref:helix-turn-helix transcriptional regulator n=1 Tax=Actinomycetospora sp. CA-084318 TaxID=3239892 RepID=UPI003D974270
MAQGQPQGPPGTVADTDLPSAAPLLRRLASWWGRARAGDAVRVLLRGGVSGPSVVDAFVADAVHGGDVVALTARVGGLPGAFVDRLLRALDLPAPVEGTAASLRARVLEALVERRGRRPLLVVVRELHLVDELSVVLLVQVLGRLRDAPVMLLCTTSAGRLGPRWQATFAGGPDDDTLWLGDLDRSETRRLETRLRRSSPATRRLLGALSVLEGDDEPADDEVVRTVAGSTSAEFADARAELVAAGLIGAEAPAGGAAGRRGPLLPAPEIVAAALDPAERRRLHRRAATVACSGRTALAHRVAGADGPDPALAAALESSARAEAADHQEAATRLLAAADLSDRPADAERRRLAAALRWVDANDTEQLALLAPVVWAASPGPERDVALGLLLSHEHRPEAVVRLQAAMHADDADREVACLAGVRLALEHVFRGRGADADDVAGVVRDRTRDPVRAEQALFLQAIARGLTDGPAAGLAVLDGRLRGALTADLAVTAGTFLLAQGDPAAARERLEEAVRRYRRGCSSVSVHRAHLYLAEALFHTGQWDLSAAEAEIALEWFADGSRPWARAGAQAVAAMVPAARGHIEEARARLDLARRSLVNHDNPQATATIALAEAVAAREQRDHVGVLAATAELATSTRPVGLATGPWVPWRFLRAEALVATGDTAAARALLAVADGEQAPLGATLTLHRLRGLIEQEDGHRDAAEAAYRTGLAIAERRRARVAGTCPVELADLQAALAHLPDVADAPRLRAAARTTFTELAADARLARLDGAGRAGDGPPGATSAPLLTPREREVARLIADGMTRREVAEVLWVSQKAVDFHLGNVFAKLGITSRRELRGRTFS